MAFWLVDQARGAVANTATLRPINYKKGKKKKMIIKVFEVRDRATCFSVMAIKMIPATFHASHLVDGVNWAQIQAAHLVHSGYGFDYPSIMMANLHGGKISYDPYDWGDRTYLVAHNHICEHFDTLKEGDVIDVEFLLGETTQPKEREIT